MEIEQVVSVFIVDLQHGNEEIGERHILLLGVENRWNDIRANDPMFRKGQDNEFKSYAISFLKQILACMQLPEAKKADDTKEEDEMLNFLQSKISQLTDSDILPIDSTP